MKKIVFSYLILNGISSIGDIVFLFFVVLATLELPYGGLLSGIMFALGAVVRIAVSPFTGKLVDKMGYDKRWKMAIPLSLFLMFAALLPGIFPPNGVSDYIWFFPLIAFIYIGMNLSVQLRTELPFRLSQNKIFLLTHYTSFGNLTSRGVYVLAPILANLIPPGYWFLASSVNAISFFFAFLASFVGFAFFRNLKSLMQAKQEKESPRGIKWMARWNNWFIFLTNLCLGGVALILTAMIKISQEQAFDVLSPVSILYLGAAIAFVVILLVPKMRFMEEANINILLLYIIVTFLMLGLASISNLYAKILFLFSAGLVYGFSLIAIAPAITRHFNGYAMVTYVSQADAFGRMGSILSSLALGLLLDRQWSPNFILSFVSICGCAVTFWLFLLKQRWSNIYSL